MNIVLLGPQGAGKGTQAQALVERLGMVHIASGDVMRAARVSDTKLGREVRRYYDAGKLVPDEITVALILDRIGSSAQKGDVLLDGFPRTVAQADALRVALDERGERIDRVIELTAPLDVVKARLAGRLICRTCGTVYNVNTMPPRTPGVCDIDGGELYQREDDNDEAIASRLAIWSEQNEELVRYYEQLTRLDRIDANRPPEAVTEDLVALLEHAHTAESA